MRNFSEQELLLKTFQRFNYCPDPVDPDQPPPPPPDPPDPPEGGKC